MLIVGIPVVVIAHLCIPIGAILTKSNVLDYFPVMSFPVLFEFCRQAMQA